ncbi:hypothetical protein Clacol_002806 [Clathrus columnatus]|uniref:Uncharacterized protein n=1 Tax=Clathrus columnatus TaxID=1419009 RepID=A0AAV5A4N6_9AGAM|nr:hypothetical protein Clacol_002806 [Clathrus columnatus]
MESPLLPVIQEFTPVVFNDNKVEYISPNVQVQLENDDNCTLVNDSVSVPYDQELSTPQPADTSPFNPDIHLSPHHKPISYITMSELGFDSIVDFYGAEERAATSPFPLLTFEGVRRIREELFSDRVLSNHLFSDTLNPSTIRGCCPDAAPFTYQFWTHPEVKRRINEAAGLNLTIVFDYEIGHTNVQLGPRGWSGLKAEPDLPDTPGELASEKEIQPTLMKTPNWHKDSYPLPPLGHAMVLQGGHIVHAVSPTDTTQERISMVTSYRPSNPLAKDTSVLKTVRTMSDVTTLHRQWCQYRLDVLSARAQLLKEQLASSEFKGNIEEEMGKFMLEHGEFLANTWGEMIKPVASVTGAMIIVSHNCDATNTNNVEAISEPTDRTARGTTPDVLLFGSEPTLTEPSEEPVVEPIVPDCTAGGGAAQGSAELESEPPPEEELRKTKLVPEAAAAETELEAEDDCGAELEEEEALLPLGKQELSLPG